MRGTPCAAASGHRASASRPASCRTARAGWRRPRAGPRRPAWRASWQCLRHGITRSPAAGRRGGRPPPWPRAARARRSGARGSSAASSACIKACRRGSRAARSCAPGLQATPRRPALLTGHHTRSCSPRGDVCRRWVGAQSASAASLGAAPGRRSRNAVVRGLKRIDHELAVYTLIAANVVGWLLWKTHPR